MRIDVQRIAVGVVAEYRVADGRAVHAELVTTTYSGKIIGFSLLFTIKYNALWSDDNIIFL